MKTDTSKATARPWSLSGDGTRVVARTDDDILFIAAVGRGVSEENDANAALIVERVNGWEALVAERDRLREALHSIGIRVGLIAAQLDTLPGMSTDADRLRKVEDAARAALEGGAP